MIPVPREFRNEIVIYVIVNGILTYLFEKIGIWYVALWWKARNDRLHEKVLQRQEAEQLKNQPVGDDRKDSTFTDNNRNMSNN